MYAHGANHYSGALAKWVLCLMCLTIVITAIGR